MATENPYSVIWLGALFSSLYRAVIVMLGSGFESPSVSLSHPILKPIFLSSFLSGISLNVHIFLQMSPAHSSQETSFNV